MADLKHLLDARSVHKIAAGLPAGPDFVTDCLQGFDDLGLMDRGRHIASVMRRHLDADPAIAVGQVAASLGTEAAGFTYLPHSCFIQAYGLPAYEESMAAMYRLTQVFTAEFCVRPFLREYPQTLGRLREWARDPSDHVRRLVSEGTRPRLPWAEQLPAFRADPEPVLALLDLLKDDRSDYVLRSVGNNLNDIAKDHPDRVLEIASGWAPRPVVRRGLRTLVKAGDTRALAILGFGGGTATARADVPESLVIGEKLRLVVHVETDSPVLVDIVVEFVRPKGSHRKVFKGAELQTDGVVRRTISLAQLSTRRVYPGPHRISVLLNGREVVLGVMDVLPAPADFPH